MDAVLEGKYLAEFHLNIMVRVIVCGMRHMPAETTEKLADLTWRYKAQGVAGFDLAGPEDGFSATIHKSAFDIVRNHCISCTLHSGEASGAASVHHSIRDCGANRIGHGVRMREDPELVEHVVNQR